MRRIATFFSTASLALCVLLCVLWLRSLWISEALEWASERQGVSRTWTKRARWLSSVNGGLACGTCTWDVRVWTGDEWLPTAAPGLNYIRPPSALSSLPTAAPAGRSVLNSLGFRLGERSQTGPATTTYKKIIIRRDFAVPYWFLTTVTAVAPAWWLVMRHRRRRDTRLRRGQCVRCGYDLRGTPDGCPECGAPASLPVAQ